METQSRVDPFVRSPTKPSFAFRTPVSWSPSGFGFVRVDHSGAHEDERFANPCPFGGDCVEVLEFDVDEKAMKHLPVHLPWPQLRSIEVDRRSESVDVRARVVHLDAYRTKKVWGEMKKAMAPEPKPES